MSSSDPRSALLTAIQEAKTQIEQEFGVQSFLEHLAQLPFKIADAQRQVHACRKALADAEAEVQTIEAIIMAEVAQETDPRTNKPAFSNDAARKAEFVKRRLQNTDWKRATGARDAAEAALNNAQIEQTLAENQFAAARAAASILAEHLHLIGGAQ